MKTYTAKPNSIQRGWYVIDATDKSVGRLAVHIANRLRGKHKPTFTPHVDTGDFIVVTNAEKIRLSGQKSQKKMYYRYSGYPGGMKCATAGEILQKDPSRVLFQAVRGMLPKNRLGRSMIKKLKVYSGSGHPHTAQQPKTLVLKGI